MALGKNKRKAFLPKKAPRPERHYARDSATLMQERMMDAKRKAVERLMMAKRISAGVGRAGGTGSA
jgi:hypothetical protein